jgi:hypothetical protein
LPFVRCNPVLVHSICRATNWRPSICCTKVVQQQLQLDTQGHHSSPKLHPVWQRVRGDSCSRLRGLVRWQRVISLMGLTFFSLHLNVWVPSNATAISSLSVKVWVYGGENTAGGISGPVYDGCNLAKDSVVVSFNYRVGPLGFLALPNAGLNGNFAIQDAILALKWIQSNIHAFGGDPVLIHRGNLFATQPANCPRIGSCSLGRALERTLPLC